MKPGRETAQMKEHDSLQAAKTLAARMGERFVRLLSLLDAGQKQALQLDFQDQRERTNWDYTPRDRRGLCLRDMDRAQHQAVTRLLKASLSSAGYNTVALIMALETVLDGKEEFTRPLPGRDPLNYHLSLFGAPDARKPWGWRFEGHHVSLHFTLAEGLLVSPFPLFFGSNPGESQLAGGFALRPLRDLEDGARALFQALGETQRRQALLSPHAPRDILLGNASRVEWERPPRFPPAPWMEATGASPQDLQRLIIRRQPAGLDARTLPDDQHAQLRTLVHRYLERFPEELAAAEQTRLGDLRACPMHFAWAGDARRGEAHYYRIHAPDFLIEYDNYQNEANHVHAVWRDPQNDFGCDALARHYAACH